MDMQRMTSQAKAKLAEPPKEELGARECTICKGELVLDAQGAAVFCDECWAEKYLELPVD